MAPSTSPPALQEATNNSTTAWQVDLETLFHQAKDRFPDVVWEVTAEEDEEAQAAEEVWGHKAIVYARAPPSFQSRYFSFRPNQISSPLPYSSSPNGTLPTTSAFSLSTGLDVPGTSRTPSPYRASSPGPTTSAGPFLRLSTSINPALFSNELEYLYTGQGFGEAFEFLFDSSESRDQGDAEELRIDKLRKDLVFMWRSRLYSDVRLALTGHFSSTNHENTTAIFSSHRFILVSRSPYFHTALISWPNSTSKQPPSEPLTLTLPSPPFTPASLHFTLGFIYTGTLVFSHRSYDLDTAFHIMRSATYLSLQTLYDEIQARIVQEMMHGLFHAFLEFSEYERLTGGKWGTGGCRCRQCARRAPRVLEFALAEDVKNPHLDRGARRALVGLFGEGWCAVEFASIPQKTRDSLLKGVGKRTTPMNVFALLFAAEHAMNKLNAIIDAWADTVREMILAARKTIDDVLCSQSEACFNEPDWLELMEDDGVRFEDGERVEWIMQSVSRGVNEKNAAVLYQTLVSSILLRPHPVEANAPMLSSTSHIRVQVEQSRMDLLHWIGKRSLGIRQEGGFDELEGWAIKEISDHIDVALEELLTPAPKVHTARSGLLKPATSGKDGDSDAMSLHSMRVSVLSRNLPKRGTTPTHRDTVSSSAASVRSARSSFSTTSRATTTASALSPTRQKHPDLPPLGPRPDSKLTPALSGPRTPSPSASPIPHGPIIETTDTEHEPHEEEQSTTPSAPLAKTLVKRIIPPNSPTDRRSFASRTTNSSAASLRPKSSTTSMRSQSSVHSHTSVRSHASTVRKSTASLRPPPATARPISSVSNASGVSGTSDGSGTFKTAPSRSRRTSGASTISNLSVRTAGAGSATTSAASSPVVRGRRLSAASTSTTQSTSAGKGGKRPPVPPLDTKKLSPSVGKRPVSSASSVKSAASGVSSPQSAAKKTVAVKKPGAPEKSKAVSNTSTRTVTRTRKVNGHDGDGTTNTVDEPGVVAKGKGKSRASTLAGEHKKNGSTTSTGSTSTLRRKASTETITKSVVESIKAKEPEPIKRAPSAEVTAEPVISGPTKENLAPQGATLDIGIPCIISSKRKRFRAYARYIGEVLGERGPWVGVEVPIGGGGWAGDRDGNGREGEERQWNDGTWGGIRYFEIGGGGGGSEWEYSGGGGYAGGYGDDRASRRRRVEGYGSGKGVKREGDTLSVGRAKKMRSVSPSMSEASGAESRGLFVRPQQVLYVVDAVGADL